MIIILTFLLRYTFYFLERMLQRKSLALIRCLTLTSFLFLDHSVPQNERMQIGRHAHLCNKYFFSKYDSNQTVSLATQKSYWNQSHF